MGKQTTEQPNDNDEQIVQKNIRLEEATAKAVLGWLDERGIEHKPAFLAGVYLLMRMDAKARESAIMEFSAWKSAGFPRITGTEEGPRRK